MKLDALYTKTRNMVPAFGSNKSAWTCCIGFRATTDDSNVSRVGLAGGLVLENFAQAAHELVLFIMLAFMVGQNTNCLAASWQCLKPASPSCSTNSMSGIADFGMKKLPW